MHQCLHAESLLQAIMPIFRQICQLLKNTEVVK